MSRNNHLGQIRRSQVLGYGPGAIIDFRAGAKGGGPVSVIAASLENWSETAKLEHGMSDPHVVREPRLEKVLGKTHFRLPPVDDADIDEFPTRFLRGFRFPSWLQCPNCKDLKYASRWAGGSGDPSRWCTRCSTEQRRVFAVPSRFVTACENGHIDEFPWVWWLGRRSGQPLACGGDADKKCRLKLESAGGSGIEGLRVRCVAEGCGASASMAGAFSQTGLEGLRCSGRQPWLTSDRPGCGATPRTLQRGASNLYFPVTFSTLSIPPWTDRIQDDLKSVWATLKQLQEPLRSQLVEGLAQSNASVHGMSKDDYVEVVRERLRLDEEVSVANLRFEEYLRLQTNELTSDFQVRQEVLPKALSGHIDRLGRVGRLREVRALTSFKRIYQPASVEDPGRGAFGNLSAAPIDWLPAVEVRGEGVFVSLPYAAIEQWASSKGVRDRVRQVDEAHAKDHERLQAHGTPRVPISPALLLVHSLAHAVIKRLSFECGYDVASLRERLYVSEAQKMAGFLVYTSTSDADGTLGGLERQGKIARFDAILRSALQDCAWCSSDPLCRSGISSLSESMNLAACHSCLLLPETCCETGNRFLDRGSLLGSVEAAGFFDDLPAPQTDD
jgi:hypothetical protein